MKTMFCICWMLGCSLTLLAQYCNLDPHKVMHYVTTDYKKNLTKRDSLLVQEVVENTDSVSLSLAWFGDSYTEQAIRDGENLEYAVFHKKSRLTRRILLDGEKENEQTRKYLASGSRNLSEEELAQEWEAYSRHFRSEGIIQLPIPDNVQPETPLPECHYFSKIGFVKAKGAVKGEYLGMEVIETPAGRFDCVKIRVESTMTCLFSGSTPYQVLTKSEQTFTYRVRRRSGAGIGALKGICVRSEPNVMEGCCSYMKKDFTSI